MLSDTPAFPQIIGLSGSFASGKDTLSHDLVEKHGYTHVSTSDIVREVAMEEEGSIERPVLHEVAKRHRYSDGPGYFAERALQCSRPIVVSGIRSLGEVKAIREAGGVMVFVDAPIEVRYERVKARKRDNETDLTLEQFAVNEEKEWYSGPTDADFNLREIKNTADVVLENATNVDDFIKSAYSVLSSL